jgi:glycosyltransferase involved in cell wall biosynthesis
MPSDDAIPPGRLLFLSHIYPSSRGTGPQLRAAALVRMLSNDYRVHLMVLGHAEEPNGPRDEVIDRICEKIIYLRILPEPGTRWNFATVIHWTVGLPTIEATTSASSDRIVQYYQENGLDRLFVYRMEVFMFISQRLECFPVRDIDMDELPSRREAQNTELKRRLEPELVSRMQRTHEATLRIMEKVAFRQFQRAYVSSAKEVEEVSRQTGFAGALVLPNIYPTVAGQFGRSIKERKEILFVGNLTYHPNIDAVLYFSREILPLILARRDVVFRIIGTGEAKVLECLKSEPGVEMLGYQENLTPYYASADVVVVPIRAGAGTRMKILEAFAHGRVVVSTSKGAEGLEVTDGKDIILADDPVMFAEACVEMMDKPEVAERVCGEAKQLHRDRYSDEALLRCYRNIEATGKG